MKKILKNIWILLINIVTESQSRGKSEYYKASHRSPQNFPIDIEIGTDQYAFFFFSLHQCLLLLCIHLHPPPPELAAAHHSQSWSSNRANLPGPLLHRRHLLPGHHLPEKPWRRPVYPLLQHLRLCQRLQQHPAREWLIRLGLRALPLPWRPEPRFVPRLRCRRRSADSPKLSLQQELQRVVIVQLSFFISPLLLTRDGKQ